MATDALALRMRAASSSRGWAWPILSAATALIGVTVLALVHQQLDLSTYLLGGAHAASNDLFTVTYPTDHLGFTYPPFSALLFAPFAHFPVRRLRGGVLLAEPRRAVRADRREPACRVRALDRRTVLWWALVLLLPVVLFDPVRQTLLLGQVNIILALMVVADMTLDLPIPRGILVGLAAAIKVTPRHPHSVPAPDPSGPRGRPRRRLVLRRRALRRRGQLLHLVGVLDALHPRPPAGRQSGRGSATRASSVRSSACWVTPSRPPRRS